VFVAAKTGPVSDHSGRCPLAASRTFADTVAPDVIVVPGGNHENLGPVVEWLNKVHPTVTWTTSVCTGSLFDSGAPSKAPAEVLALLDEFYNALDSNVAS
jgi:putative intracellular protease/amidase